MPQLEITDFAPQLIWLAICFIALYIFLARVALPRIATVIEERSDRISRDLDEAERIKAQTEKAIASYEQALAEARAKAHAIAQETRDKLNAEIERERAEVDKKISEKTAEAEARIMASKTEALSQVSDVAEDTVQTLLEELIGATPSKTEIADAVGSTLKSG